MKKINKQLININYSKGSIISPKYIVIHETANVRNGANAMANRNYFANHSEAKASAHFVVDDTNIVQCLELYWRAWHVGDNRLHSDITNTNSLGIEICVNADGDYSKAVQNAVELTRYLMNQLTIPIENIKTHFDASGKNCPAIMLKNKAFDKFKEAIMGATISVPEITPTPPSGVRTLSQAKLYIGYRILELQQKLIKCGYNLPKYGADGNFGNETYTTLIRFQKEQGLKVDALAGTNTFAKLDQIINRSNIPTKILRFGNCCAEVKILQRKLNEKLGVNLDVDSDFGNKTLYYTKMFQTMKGLKVDGIVGAKTWEALFR